MKKLIITLCAMAACAVAEADITISWPSNPQATLEITEIEIAGKPLNESTLVLKEGKAVYAQDETQPVNVRIKGSEEARTSIYLSPGEDASVEFDSEGSAIISGTPLLDGMQSIFGDIDALRREMFAYQEAEGEEKPDWQARYNAILTDYIAAHPDSPAAAFAVLYLDGKDFMSAYEGLTPAARQSIVMPIVEKQREEEMKHILTQERMEQMQTEHMPAPAFTLPGLDGNPVSLADFRGKWVVLDFWGSWCRWCIKGFPELKEAYAKYSPELVVIGIDNRDSVEQWREAVAKYELPWVNVYNDFDEGGIALCEAYALQGFPHKVIIDPEGNIRHITVGEDPEFYEALKALMGR